MPNIPAMMSRGDTHTMNILQQRLSKRVQHVLMIVLALQNMADRISMMSANSICMRKTKKISGSSNHRQMFKQSVLPTSFKPHWQHLLLDGLTLISCISPRRTSLWIVGIDDIVAGMLG